MRGVLTVIAGLVLQFPALAQTPVVQGVTDSATYAARVAPGSLASIFGTNLAAQTESAGDFPLPASLGGASVMIGGVSAPLLYSSATQINFQVPSSLAGGASNLVVTGPGGASAAFSVTVTTAAPGIYQYGVNRAVAQNQDGALNASNTPAGSGSTITVYLTGIGAVNNPVTDGTAASSSPLSSATASFSATIGASAATVQFLGLSPGFAGLAQANIVVPNLPSGDYPLVMTVGGFIGASAVVSVSGSGSYTSPLTLAGSAAFSNSATSSVALFDNIAYVCGANQIVMVDVTTPTSPNVLGSFGSAQLNGFGDHCAINTNVSTPYLVATVGNNVNAESFAVWSLSNPKSPALLDVASTPYAHMENMTFSGNLAFVTTSFITYTTNNGQITTQNGMLLVFDFTNPSRPVLVTALNTLTTNLMPDSEVIDSIYVYIASSTATGSSTSGTGVLNSISISSPSTPALLDQVSVSQAAILLSFDISGTTLLAAGSTAGQRNPGVPDFDFTGNLTLTTMNLANPATPVVVGTLVTGLQVNGTFNLAGFSTNTTSGVFALVNNPPMTDDFGPASLMIADCRTPTNILLYPFQTQFGLSGILTTSNGFLMAPTALGLNIYQLQL
jgi:uncharacterized protein (TIGR03437 family)